MEQDEIVRRNTAIANWAWESHPDHPDIWFEPVGGFPWSEEMLCFHTDWRELMPVVEKIVKEWDPNKMIGRLHGDKLDFVSTFWYSIWSIERVNSKPMIEAVFISVSDYCLAQQEGK